MSYYLKKIININAFQSYFQDKPQKSTHSDQQKDIRKLVSNFMKHGLFEYCPPRAHDGICNPVSKEPRKMGKKLALFNNELDFWAQQRASRKDCN